MVSLVANEDAERARLYGQHGAVLVPGVFTSDEVELIRHTFTSQVESSDRSLDNDDGVPDGDILKRYPRFVHPHRKPETEAGALARRLLVDQRLFGVVQDLVGPVYAAQSMFYFKPPGARGQAMHQDNWFLQAHPETCIAAWIAVDAADAENGALKVIPGTHRGEVQCHIEADPTVSFSNQTVPLPDLPEVQTTLAAGDVLFFHGSLVHGSLPNASDRFRRSLIFHYIPQASVEIAKVYQPLIREDGTECRIGESPLGGPCGDGWQTGE